VKKNSVWVPVVLVMVLALCSPLILSGGGEAEKEEVKLAVSETRGPQGEKPTWAKDLVLTEAEKEKIRAGNFKGAILCHLAKDYPIWNGVRDVWEDLGIEEVIFINAEFDPAKQAADVETALARKPDCMVTLVLDHVTGAKAFQPAVDAGVKLALLSNLPQGYVHDEDYVGIITDDLWGMGRAAAELMADALGGKGKVGMIFHDADFWITNQRDNAFRAVIQNEFPDIEIVDEKGIAGQASEAENAASAMITQHPDIQAIYSCWDSPAEGVLAAIRAAKRPDIKVISIDLNETLALDMALDGNTVAIASDEHYGLGTALGILCGYGLIDKPAPPFSIVGTVKVRKDNLVEAWRATYHEEPPVEVMKALGK